MKRSLLYLTFVLGSLGAWAQGVPQTINYQGIARRASGSTINNQSFGLQFKIMQVAGNTVVFTEAQTKSSNSLGLFTAQIGSASNLSAVNWSNGPYSLEVSIDTTGGTNYVSLGTQVLSSVPYALSAPSPTLAYNNNILSVGDNSVGIYVGGSSPSLSVSGSTLSISGGNSVTLPSTTTVTASGASTWNNIAGGVNIHTDSVTVNPYFLTVSPLSPPSFTGIGQILGSYPNYTLMVAPAISYDPIQGILNLSSLPFVSPPGQSYSYNYTVAPNVNLSGALLSVGPKSQDLNPIAPWRWDQATNTSTLAGIASQSVGINNALGVLPTAELEVTGYTKLGSSGAPGIKMLKFTGTTSSAASGIASIPLGSSGIALSKILAVSVLVDATGSGDWVPPSNNIVGTYDYSWKINSAGSSIDITNGGASTSILGKTIKVLITYEQ